MGMKKGGNAESRRNSSVGISSEPAFMVAKQIGECEGNLLRTAHFLGISRRQLYYRIDEFKLWPIVNEARRRSKARRRALRDERTLQGKRRFQ